MIETEAMRLVERTNYLNKDINYLRNIPIREYDLKSAGFSVIKYYKMFSDEKISELEAMNKEDRNIYIGKQIIARPEINEKILHTLEAARKALVYSNNLNPDDILSIKKDAVFIIRKEPTNLIFKNTFEFRPKNTYTSYLYINNKEFYYDSYNDILDVKGISDDNKELQKDFLLNDIKKILRSCERLQYDEIFKLLKSYRHKYLNKDLPIDTYRDMNTGKYSYGNFEIDDADNVEDIDISQNYLNYVLPMIKAIL